MHINLVQRAGTGSRNKSTPAPSAEAGQALEQHTQAREAETRPGGPEQVCTSPQCRGPAGARTSVQEPHVTEGELRGLRQVGTSPKTEGGPRGPRQVCTSPMAQRVSLGGQGKPMQITLMQRNPHKHLPSKFRTAAQGRTEQQTYGQ